MINILEIVYGGGITPNSNPIHIFDIDRDLYEHAEFIKENDFYQIVKVDINLVLYNFKKTEAVDGIKLEGNWWLLHENFKHEYKNRGPNIFQEKINDRISHGYRIAKLVVSQQPKILNHHPDYNVVKGIFPL